MDELGENIIPGAAPFLPKQSIVTNRRHKCLGFLAVLGAFWQFGGVSVVAELPATLSLERIALSQNLQLMFGGIGAVFFGTVADWKGRRVALRGALFCTVAGGVSLSAPLVTRHLADIVTWFDNGCDSHCNINHQGAAQVHEQTTHHLRAHGEAAGRPEADSQGATAIPVAPVRVATHEKSQKLPSVVETHSRQLMAGGRAGNVVSYAAALLDYLQPALLVFQVASASGLAVASTVLLCESVDRSSRAVSLALYTAFAGMGLVAVRLVTIFVEIFVRSRPERLHWVHRPEVGRFAVGVGVFLSTFLLLATECFCDDTEIFVNLKEKNGRRYGEVHDSRQDIDGGLHDRTRCPTAANAAATAASEIISPAVVPPVVEEAPCSSTTDVFHRTPSSASRLSFRKYFKTHAKPYLIGVTLPLVIVVAWRPGAGIYRPHIIPWDPQSPLIEDVILLVVKLMSLIGNVLAALLLLRLCPKLLQLLGLVLSAFTFFGLAVALFSVGKGSINDSEFGEAAQVAVIYDWIFNFVTAFPVVSTYVILAESYHTKFRGRMIGIACAASYVASWLDAYLLGMLLNKDATSTHAICLLIRCSAAVAAIVLTVGWTPRLWPSNIDLFRLDAFHEKMEKRAIDRIVPYPQASTNQLIPR